MVVSALLPWVVLGEEPLNFLDLFDSDLVYSVLPAARRSEGCCWS